MQRGSVEDGSWLSRVWPGSVRVQHASAGCSVAKKGAVWLSEGEAWLSSGCGVAQFRVQYGSVQGVVWLSTGCGIAQLKGAALLS